MLIYLNEFKSKKETGKQHRLYKCECGFCHKVVMVPKHRMDNNISCGCHKKAQTKDLVFHDITYTGESEQYKDFNQRVYIGHCVCGNLVKTHSSQLKKKKSCGCVKHKDGRSKEYTRVSKYFAESFLVLARTGAKRRKIEFDITLEDLDAQFEAQDGKCYYTGTKLIPPKCPSDCYRQRHLHNISIDRINSDKHYTRDNIHLVIKPINKMKLTHSSEEFIEYCHQVSRNFS